MVRLKQQLPLVLEDRMTAAISATIENMIRLGEWPGNEFHPVEAITMLCWVLRLREEVATVLLGATALQEASFETKLGAVADYAAVAYSVAMNGGLRASNGNVMSDLEGVAS
jgi:hypothetical protein